MAITRDELVLLINSTKDVMQIVFFVVAGTVTILTYMHAKKTLFTPIKTEVFKLQIKAFEDILAFFQNKSETDFTTVFDLDTILKSNARLMFSEFVEHFYKNELTVNKDKNKELIDSFQGAIVTQSWAEKNFTSLEYYENDLPKKPEEITNPAIILEYWKGYEYGPIHFTKKYFEESEKLKLLIASPLTPVKLKNELIVFNDTVAINLTLVGSILNEIAQELPRKFSSAASVKNFNAGGIWNKYNDKKTRFEPISVRILEYIRNYLKIDRLVE